MWKETFSFHQANQLTFLKNLAIFSPFSKGMGEPVNAPPVAQLTSLVPLARKNPLNPDDG